MKKQLLLLFVALLLISFVSSAEWDNVKSYDETTKEITISNSILFIPTSTIAKIKLNTPLNNVVGLGYQKVAEFTIINYGDYNDALKTMEFYNLRENSKTITRDFDYKLKESYQVDINDYRQTCKEDTWNKNSSKFTSCANELIGTHKETRYRWVDSSKSLTEGTYTIGIFIDVQQGDYVEWIPTYYGVKIDEWATWIASLNTNLIAYYKLDETAGEVIDTIGNYNGVNNGSTANIGGKINTAYNLSNDVSQSYPTSNESIYIGNMTDLTYSSSRSYSMWVNPTTLENYETIIGGVSEGATGGFGITIGSSGAISSGAPDASVVSANQTIQAGEWTHIVVIWNGTHISHYVNGTEAGVGAHAPAGYPMYDVTMGTIRTNGDTTKYYFNGAIDEVAIWNRVLTSEEAVLLYNEGDGLAYGGNVNLNYPDDNAQLLSGNINFNASISFSGTVQNVSLYINGSLISTNTSGINNVDYLFPTYLTKDIYSWIVEGCDTTSSCVNSSSRILIIQDFSENSQTYNNVTYETATETFTINLTYLSANFSLSGYLNYGGVNYTGTRTGTGDTNIITREIEIPSTDGGYQTFFWWIGLTNSTATYWSQSSQQNQTVNKLSFGICNSTFNTTALNFTLYNQINQTLINATETPITFKATFRYWQSSGSGDVYANYSYQNISTNETNNFRFCISPSNLTLRTNADIEFSAIDYSPNNYYLRNASITNQTNNISLYLLGTSSSTKFTVTINYGSTTLPFGIVTISKYFTGEGLFKTTGIKETDDAGRFTDYLEIDQKYKFSIVKDGVLLGISEKTAICSASPCIMTIVLVEASADLWAGYYSTYSEDTISNITYNDTSKMVTYDFVDTTGLSNYFRLVVKKLITNTTESTAICDTTAYTTSGSLTCNMTGYDGDFIAKGYVSRSPEKLDKILTFVISTLKEALGLMGIFFSLGLIITFVFAFATISRGNPAVVIVAFAIIFTLTKLMGFLPLSWSLIMLVDILCFTVAYFTRT